MHSNPSQQQSSKTAKNGHRQAPGNAMQEKPAPSPSTLTSLEASPPPAQRNATGGRISPILEGSPSFADVTAGRRSTSPPLNNGRLLAPRLVPSPCDDDVPSLDIGPPAIIASSNQSSLIQDTAPANITLRPAPAPQPQAATNGPRKSSGAARDEETGWVEVRRNGRKRVVARQDATNATLGLGAPPGPPTPSPAPRAYSDSARGRSDHRKRRRLSTEEIADGGETSQPQPSLRLQPSPGPPFARTILPEQETSYDAHRPPAVPPHPRNSSQSTILEPQPVPAHSSQRPLPPTCHPSAAIDITEDSWRQVPSDTDLFWDPRIRRLTEELGPQQPAPSDVGSYADADMDEIIRSIRLPPPEETTFFNPPAVVMANMMSGGPLPRPAYNLGNRNEGSSSLPIRQTEPLATAPVSINADSSAFTAHWANGTWPREPNAREPTAREPVAHHERVHPPSTVVPQSQPERARSSLPREPYRAHNATPRPQPAQAGSSSAQPRTPTNGSGHEWPASGPSRERSANGPPQDRAQSRASVLSYVTIQPERNQRQAPPNDHDAMEVDDEQDFVNAPAPLFHRPQRAPRDQPPPPHAQPQQLRGNAAEHLPLLEDQLEDMNSHTNSGIDWLSEDITQPPPQSWRPIQFHSVRDVFIGQDEQQALLWRQIALQRPCVLLQIGGHGACEDDDSSSWQRYELLKEILWVLLGVDRKQLLAPQRARGVRPSMNEGPFYIMVTNVTEFQEAEMIRWYWLSTRWLSVNFIPFPTPLPTYLATWESSTAFVSTRLEDAVSMFARGFRRSPLFACTLRTIRRDKDRGAAGIWGDTPVVDAFNLLIDSIHVRVLPRMKGNGDPSPLFVLYCEPPTNHVEDWEIFRDTVRGHSFGVAGGRSPDLVLETHVCSICHSIDHTVGFCDLPDIRGWNGPQRELYSSTPANPQRENHGRKRGGKANRGRGNENGRGRGSDNGRGRGTGYGRGRGGRGGPSANRSYAGPSLDQASKNALLRGGNPDPW
ncbi:uncharacterized protein C8Q71DRAFT_862949 [Rhodofomes roseus]|uniref:Uncharacterized protein n=1 Tax=Rhodofomes roseus TaxID=34475 RepID=A0ABQ8JZT4_9APHY|nr:uncharacterized protein C8Q71DRAFT_862949 [Rhodofomes roseus]KAH9829844.1 hypothetical protein C8Q71DRAFT_862949 [Rhodofomes roseus]